MTLAEPRRANEFVFTFVDEISRGGGNPGWCWETVVQLPRNLAETTKLVSCVASPFVSLDQNYLMSLLRNRSSGPLCWKRIVRRLTTRPHSFQALFFARGCNHSFPFSSWWWKWGEKRTITKQNCFPQLRKSPSLYYFFPFRKEINKKERTQMGSLPLQTYKWSYVSSWD